MKRFIIIAILVFVLPQISASQTSLVFGVKPGLNLNSAYIGINQGNFTPYLGVDMLWLSASGSYETTSEDYFDSYHTFEVNTTNYDGNAFLIVPHLGAKLFLGSKLAKPYIFGDVFLALPSVKVTADGVMEKWEYRNLDLIRHTTENTTPYTGDIKQTVKEILSFWGFSFGGGAEYFFSPNFSIGGEYGVRVIFDKAKYSERNADYPDYSYPSDKFKNQWQTDVSASLKVSYAAVSVNFYF